MSLESTNNKSTSTQAIGNAAVLAPAPVPEAIAPIKRDKIDAEDLGKDVLPGLLGELMALPAERLAQINIDIPTVVTTALGVVSRVQEYRAGVQALMSSFDKVQFDKLDDYATALDLAHVRYLKATKPADEVAKALEEAADLRGILLADTTALICRGLLPANALTELKGSVGHKNLATDLHLLVDTLTPVLASAVGKSGVTAEELDRAYRLHRAIYRLVGLRDQNVPVVNAASKLRQRDYTALLNCYDHVRHGITALRWKEGDADEIVPSLHKSNGAGRKAASAAPEVAGGSGANANNSAGTGNTAGTNGAALPPTSNGATTPLTTAGTGKATAVAAGKPGADPFLS